MKVAIIGGGLMGLAIANRLADKNYAITVFEGDTQLGGLATYHDYGSFVWDRFYHVILPTDQNLMGYIRDIGLGDEFRWQQTFTGFYVDEQFHSMSSNLEFLRFPPVSLIGKMRMAFTILYCSRIKNWHKLENVPVGEWLERLSGRKTYEKIWKPLLLAKLGESYRRVSAVFIWSYIKRMFSARDSSAASKEHLGYVSGGYRSIINRSEQRIKEKGGDIRIGVRAEHIGPHDGGGLWVQSDGHKEHFDKVVFTSPVNVLSAVASPELVDVSGGGKQVEYLGVVCMVLITRRPLTPYYIVNITDSSIPFTGVIGMSNIVDTSETNGLHLTYLPKYVLSDDPFLRKPDEEVNELFFAGLRKMFPELKDEDIESVHINRAIKVQPLQVLNYSQIVPKTETRHEDFFVVNTSQFVIGTLNNNEVITAAEKFVEMYEPRLAQSSSAVADAAPVGELVHTAKRA